MRHAVGLCLWACLAMGVATAQEVPLTPAGERGLKPQDTFRECAGCPEMVVLPAGSFMMGSPDEEGLGDEGPRRTVTFAWPFAVGRFEVTRGEFAAFAGESGHPVDGGCFTNESGRWDVHAERSFRNPGFFQDDRHPAVCVNRDDATAFAKWLSGKTGKTYRLLTEAEWEYAARAVTSTSAPGRRYWWGDAASRDHANYGKEPSGTEPCCRGHREGKDRWEFTAPVGQFPANPFGLHDLNGNVWEWVQDCYDIDYARAPGDGSAVVTEACSLAVRRGGSWLNREQSLRSAGRSHDSAAYRHIDVGFRIARTLAH